MAIPSFPQYVFMVWCLVKHRTTLALPLLLPLPNHKNIRSVWSENSLLGFHDYRYTTCYSKFITNNTPKELALTGSHPKKL
jgi:hypothetical protein